GGADALGSLLEQSRTGRLRPGRIVHAEDGAEITQLGGGEQRVHSRMGRNVTVGVSRASSGLVRPEQSGHPARSTRLEPVGIGADPDPWGHVELRSVSFTIASATARSSGVVIFMASTS